jgi:pilus assembly protein CpaB
VIGEPIRETKLIKANGSGFMAAILPAGMRAISTDISPETGAGGFILPNDHVDVILTRHDREAEKVSGTEVHTSETILSNVRVLAIDQTIEEKNGQKVVVGKTATLALLPRQAETLALSRQLGTLSLALRSLADDNNQLVEGAHDDDNAANRRLNMVRFGVSTSAITK